MKPRHLENPSHSFFLTQKVFWQKMTRKKIFDTNMLELRKCGSDRQSRDFAKRIFFSNIFFTSNRNEQKWYND